MRTEKLNRVKLVEKEKDELEGPKNEAMAYIKLENDLAQSKYSLQQVLFIFESFMSLYLIAFSGRSIRINRIKSLQTVNRRKKKLTKKWEILRANLKS